MKVLFLLLEYDADHKGDGMYVDLIDEYVRQGHSVTVMAPDNNHKRCFEEKVLSIRVIRVASRRTQGVPNMINKGIALATLPLYFRLAFIRFLKNESFDWVIMPTPPITLSPFVGYVKRKTGAKFYLILRDIHPQSVWSIGLLHYKWMYKYLDNKARVGYRNADLIGCMSKGNINFIKNNYPCLKQEKLVLLYNWLSDIKIDKESDVRAKYNLKDKYVALFGGTIGLGQKIENLIFLAEYYKNNDSIIFLVVGKGVEKDRLKRIVEEKDLKSVVFLDYMPQRDYLNLTSSVDVGLISINDKYAVPTCPSKAVAYMAMGVPMIAIINPNSDYGSIIENAGAGLWTVGTEYDTIIQLFDKIYDNKELRKEMGNNGRRFYMENCTPEKAYCTMFNQMTSKQNERKA